MTRIYLVDDHTLVREGLRALLESDHHVVVGEASDPTAALSDIVRLAPELLIVDLSLADRSGFELMEEMNKRKLSTRCLVLTMSAQPRHVAESIRLGAFGYILKGSSRAELLRAVNAVSAGNRFLGPEISELAAQALRLRSESDMLDELSPRERQILVLIARGHTSASIGETLHLSAKTVDTYRSRLMTKLGINNVAGVVLFAVRQGLISDQEA